MNSFEELLSHFKIQSRHGNRAQCICPAHNDKQASLTITDRGEKALCFCHAGCKTADVLTKAGLRFKDLYYDN